MARTKNPNIPIRRGSRRPCPSDDEERGPPLKRSVVVRDGSGQVEEDDDNDSEEQSEQSEKDCEEDFVVIEETPSRKTRGKKRATKVTAPKKKPITKTLKMPVRQGLVLQIKKPRHTRNYDVTNYKTMSTAKYIRLRDVDHFHGQKSAADSRFWSHVQQDIYESILLEQSTILVPQRRVNIAFLEENPLLFPGCVELIDAMGLRGILTLHRDWSEEAVAQFYATCLFVGDDESTLRWMTQGVKLMVSFEEFADLLNISIEGDLYQIHSESTDDVSMTAAALDPLRQVGWGLCGDETLHRCSTLKPLYQFMFHVITKALVPKIGDRGMVRNFAIDLLVRMHTHGHERFDLADFLFQQIRLASYEQKRSFPYAPFIQVLIDAKFKGGKIFKDCKHNMWTPRNDMNGAKIPSGKKNGTNHAPLARPSKFERFMAKTQQLLFQICSSNADAISNIKSVDRVKINKYKAQVRELGGVASEDEATTSSSTACPKFSFPTERYAEFFEKGSSDEEGSHSSEGDSE